MEQSLRIFTLAAAGVLLSLGAAQAAGNPEAGAKVFNRCKVCHTAEPGQNRVGPSLYGVVGRMSGTEPGFNYSPAMKNAHIVWTPENLDKYLTDPKAMVPGNKMAFPGVKDPKERQDVISYLEKVGSGH